MQGKWVLLSALGASLVLAGTAKADELGYIDCTSHPDDTQVLAKAAKTQEVVATVPCGERFTIVQSGFFFSRIQTKDGKVGFVFTNQISKQYVASAAPQPAPQAPLVPAKMAARSNNPLSAIASAFKSKQGSSAQGMRVPAPPAPAPAAAPAKAAETAEVAAVQPAPAASPAPVATQAQASAAPAAALVSVATNVAVAPAPVSSSAPPQAAAPAVQVATTNAPKNNELFPAKSSVIVQSEAAPAAEVKPAGSKPTPAPVSAANFPAKSAVIVQSETTPTAQPQPAPTQPAPVPTAPAPAAAVAINATEAAAMIAQPQPESSPAVTPSEPAPAEPAASNFQPEPVQPARKAKRQGHWYTRLPSMELFGGYTFARFDDGAGTFTNIGGGMGAFGLNVTSWLQVVADSSYNVMTSNGVKTILYGNHYGPRLYWNRRSRFGIRPFVEGLVGGSRVDTSLVGVSGYATSDRVLSYKVGGGLDIKPSRYLEIRLIDVDYYRTAFAGVKPYQNNYWASTGVVLRLFGHAE